MKRLIIGFILGLFLVITPTLLYFYFNNSLYEMIDAAYLFAFKYAVEESIKLRFSLLLSMVFAMFLVVFREKNYRKIIFLLLSATIDTLLLCLGQGYIHYYQVLIPVFTYCYALLCKEKTKNYRLLLLTILFVLNLPSFVKHCGAEYVDIVQNTPKLEGTFWGNIAEKATNFDSFSGNMHGYKGKAYVEDILVHMDKNQLDSVYNFSTRPNWIYYAKHLKLYNRYIQTPVFFIKCNPIIQEEIMSDLDVNPPFYIVTENNTDEENVEIVHWINSNYSLIYENELYQLHEKNYR